MDEEQRGKTVVTQDQYPYIQTLSGLENGVDAYSIQSVDGDATGDMSDERVFYSFGPLAAINIFVGATNAGKSRFLRILAKSQKHDFYTEDIHSAITNLMNCFYWLLDSDESITLEIKQDGNHLLNGQPIVFYNMPSWVEAALPGVVAQQNYKSSLDKNLFFTLKNRFVDRISSLFEAKKPDKTSDLAMLNETYMLSWIYNLIVGEENARVNDSHLSALPYSQVHTHQSLKVRTSPALLFDFDSVSVDWRSKYKLLWESYVFLEKNHQMVTEAPPQRIYIPTLRSAVSLKDEDGKRLSYDIFEKTVRTNYAMDNMDDTSFKIFTGNRLYDTLQSDRNGTAIVRLRLSDFERFLGGAFYEGRNVDIVAVDAKYEAGQHINVSVQGETPRDLHHLGDGINTLVILLYQLFMAEPGSWIFIEEPEINLHPGLQRIFLQTLIENEALRDRRLRVFFTTHSNHLLRMTLRDGTIATKDISVFAFQQRASDKDRFLIRPLLSEHHDALALLGVQNASVLLAQCGIWVEGVTDRQYLRAYLNAYQDSDEFKKDKRRVMREDTHFAFWEYAGSNLSHYLMRAIPRKGTEEADEYERGAKSVRQQIESSALCNRIFLLADRDEKKSKKHEMLRDLAANHNNLFYCVTPCIEIENLLSPDEIMAFLPEFFRKKTLTFVPTAQADYKDKRMGRFLYETYPDDCPEAWVAASGTLETDRKNRFCELAVAHITWKTMSREAKAVTKSFYDFVAKHNDI